nr:MAG TPA: hypothetical protein [Caudoviricetes sp.]
MTSLPVLTCTLGSNPPTIREVTNPRVLFIIDCKGGI